MLKKLNEVGKALYDHMKPKRALKKEDEREESETESEDESHEESEEVSISDLNSKIEAMHSDIKRLHDLHSK